MDGVISNYQSGFLYESDSQLKPGLVSHMLAIDHNLDSGARTYDFLAGDQRFLLGALQPEALFVDASDVVAFAHDGAGLRDHYQLPCDTGGYL